MANDSADGSPLAAPAVGNGVKYAAAESARVVHATLSAATARAKASVSAVIIQLLNSKGCRRQKTCRDSRFGVRYLNGDVRQRFIAPEPLPIERTVARLVREHRYDGTQVPRAQTPQMQIDEPIPIRLDRFAHLCSHTMIGIHVEQDTSGIAYQAK